MKLRRFLILICLLLIPITVNGETLNAYQKALKETADAFLRKSDYFKYSNTKDMVSITPEMASNQNYLYTQCANFASQIYKDALGVDIRTSTLHIGGCAYYQKDNHPEVVVGLWSKNAGMPDPSTITLNDLVSKMKMGDIIIGIQSNKGHTMMVYEVNGANTLLIEANEIGDSLVGNDLNLYYSGAIRTYSLSTALEYYKGSKEVFLIRPLGNNNTQTIDFNNVKHGAGGLYDMTTYTCDELSSPVSFKITDNGKCRNKYPKMDITKTVSVTNKTVINKSNVEVGDNLIYKIVINNNSSSAYNGLSIVENVSTNATVLGTPPGSTISGNTITWNNVSIPGNSNKVFTYTAKVNTETVGETITSTGKVCDIPTATIENVVIRNLTSAEKTSIMNKYDSSTELITPTLTSIYNSVLNLNKDFSGFTIKKTDSNNGLIVSKGMDEGYTNPASISLNSANSYYNMVYNNYYGGRVYNSSTNKYQLRYWGYNWLMNPNPSKPSTSDADYDDKMAFYNEYHIADNYRSSMIETIYKEHFQTGDILVTMNGTTSNKYIYLEKDDGRKFYNKTTDTFPSDADNEDSVNYNKLFNNDLYVVLRPVLAVRNIPVNNPTVTSYTGNYDGNSHTITVGTVSGGTIKYSTDNKTWSTTKPTRTTVGTTTVYVKVVGDSTHKNSKTIIGKIVINKVDSKITCSNKTYNGSAQTIATCNGGTISNASQTNAGSYSITCAGDSNHNNSTETCYINKKTITAPSVNGYSGTYDGKSHTITVGTVSVGTLNYSTNNSAWSTTKPTRTAAGTTTVYVKVVGDNNYDDSSTVSSTIEIAKANSGITCLTPVYNGSTQTIATCSGGTISNASQTDAGIYPITCTGDSNHNNTTKTCSISKKKASLPSVTSYTGSYDGKSHTITVGTTNEGTIKYSTDNSTWTTTKPTRTNAGSTTVYVKVFGDSNHSDSNIGASIIKVNKVNSEITCLTPLYNGSAQTIATCSGGTISNANQTNAGSYPITCTGDSNHNNTTKTCSISKKKAELPSVTSYTGSYDGKSHTITVGTTNEGTIKYSTDNSTWTTTKPTRTNTGSTTVYVKVVGDSNHSDSNIGTSTIKINKANSKITCSNKTYNGKVQTIATCSGGTISNANQTNAGSYSITCAGDSNHNNSTETCYIYKQAIATPSINSYTGNYDGKSHTITVGTVSGGTIKYSTDNNTWNTTKPTRTNAGTTTVYVKVFGDSNHNDSNTGTGTININKVHPKSPIVNSYMGDFDGEEHTVIVSNVEGGIINYSLDNSTWSEVAPTRKNVGETVVYVKLVGDSNHDDSVVTTAKITIKDVNDTKTILYNSNSESNETETQDFDSSSEVKLEKNPFEREDYEFKDWNTKADGTGTSYTEEEVVSLSSSTTLYAMWEEDGYEINNYNVDDVDNYITRIPVNTNINTFISNINVGSSYNLSIDYAMVNNVKLLYTGGKTKIMKGSTVYKEYTNAVVGDLNGDGVTNSADLLKTRQHLLGVKKLSGVYFISSDINNDGIINSADLLRIRQHLLGIRVIK